MIKKRDNSDKVKIRFNITLRIKRKNDSWIRSVIILMRRDTFPIFGQRITNVITLQPLAKEQPAARTENFNPFRQET